MEKSLNLAFTITPEWIKTVITEPESGEQKEIGALPDLALTAMHTGAIADEIASWLSLWLDEQTENSSCSAAQ